MSISDHAYLGDSRPEKPFEAGNWYSIAPVTPENRLGGGLVDQSALGQREAEGEGGVAVASLANETDSQQPSTSGLPSNDAGGTDRSSSDSDGLSTRDNSFGSDGPDVAAGGVSIDVDVRGFKAEGKIGWDHDGSLETDGQFGYGRHGADVSVNDDGVVSGGIEQGRVGSDGKTTESFRLPVGPINRTWTTETAPDGTTTRTDSTGVTYGKKDVFSVNIQAYDRHKPEAPTKTPEEGGEGALPADPNAAKKEEPFNMSAYNETMADYHREKAAQDRTDSAKAIDEMRQKEADEKKEAVQRHEGGENRGQQSDRDPQRELRDIRDSGSF